MTVPKAEAEAADRRSLHERIAADPRGDIMSGRGRGGHHEVQYEFGVEPAHEG